MTRRANKTDCVACSSSRVALLFAKKMKSARREELGLTSSNLDHKVSSSPHLMRFRGPTAAELLPSPLLREALLLPLTLFLHVY